MGSSRRFRPRVGPQPGTRRACGDIVTTADDTALWREVYQGGSAEAEQEHFRQLAAVIVEVQRANRQSSGSPSARRTFHAKIVVGVEDAELAVADDLAAELSVGHFTPGARLPVTVRLSNASGTVRSDGLPDLRGAVLKIAR